MGRLLGTAGVLTLLCAGAAIAQSEPPVSYSWVETASAEVAGQRLLGPLARVYPNFSGPQTGHFSSGRLESVAFASKARASGAQGVCESDVIWLTFWHDRETPWTEPADGGAETAPVTVRNVRTETRFRGVGDTTPRPWTEAYEAELDAACAAHTDGWDFGIAEDGFSAGVAIRLQTLLPDMAESESEALLALLDACTGDECASPLALFAQMRTARFHYGDVRPCDALADIYRGPRFDGPYCLTARFRLNDLGNEVDWLVVTARFETTYDAAQEMLDPRLLGLTLTRQSIIED